MRLEVYQEETDQIARYQGAILAEARDKLSSGQLLTPLEQNGVLHALQVLIENAIGKAKHLLKASGHDVPISAYDAFALLAEAGNIPREQLAEWNRAVGLRNRIVHDYMNIRMELVLESVNNEEYKIVVDFLRHPMVSRDE